MLITLVNMSARISDVQLQTAIRAINRQVHEDFAPQWGLIATLRLGGKSQLAPDHLALPDLRGDAVLYVWDKVDVPDALGYHDANARGIPYGFVFTDLADALNEKWTVTLSHEALELIADPLVNLLVAGPHPSEDRTVFHWHEMSDAVQNEEYLIDGVAVSNFVLPLYFTPAAEPGSRNDFLGTRYREETLPSFGVNPGGYIGFFDPQLGKHVTFAMAGDEVARQRLAVKRSLSADTLVAGRRAYRIAGSPRVIAPRIPGDSALRASNATRGPRLAAPPTAVPRGDTQRRAIEGMARAVSATCARQFVAIDVE